MNESRNKILAVAAELGLSMSTKFVPWSQSRKKGEKQPSLNWLVTIERNGKPILTTDYMAGMAHAPSYKQGDRTIMRDELVRWECEHGKRVRWSDGINQPVAFDRELIEPDLADVLNALASDYSVLDASTYEDWAADFGYDPDSRKGEAIYRACLDIALKLRNGVGEDGMSHLRDACEGY